MSLRIAVLIKQVPRLDAMSLNAVGSIRREETETELNPYCRRAVAKGVELAQQTGGTCIAFSMGPATADEVLREAIAWGADKGVLVSDSQFAGSDTLGTARVLIAALYREGPFDLILMGRNSVDADTSQVAPHIAELLDLPLLAGVRTLEMIGGEAAIKVKCEYDDGWVVAQTRLPVVVTCAERLCDPAKVNQLGRDAVDAARITLVDAAALGPGPWGSAASHTIVKTVRPNVISRAQDVLSGPLDQQITEAIQALLTRNVLPAASGQPARSEHRTADRWSVGAPGRVPGPVAQPIRSIVVVSEPNRPEDARALLGYAAMLAASIEARVVVMTTEPLDVFSRDHLWRSWGADHVVRIRGSIDEADVARAMASWLDQARPWAVLSFATMWGREVTARIATRLDAGLISDAIDLTIADDRLVATKFPFGGQQIVEVTTTSAIQLATVRPGVLPALIPRSVQSASQIADQIADQTTDQTVLIAAASMRIERLDQGRDDDLALLEQSQIVIGVGNGVELADYPLLEPLASVFRAQLAATRKVTDRQILPRSRQIGITARTLSPRLYIAIGLSGRFNHLVGVRSAKFILAINQDANAPIFNHCDVGIVADWRTVVPLLATEAARSGIALQGGEI